MGKLKGKPATVPADAKTRFSSRVADYVKYRPTYPRQVLEVCRGQIGMTSAWTLADVGSGTGISDELFLSAGQAVYCVEPNADMRAAAERQLSRYAGFRSIDGSAEQTTLADGSIDMVVAAQAFHWFDKPAARREFARVLRPGGQVLLMWNQRRTSGTPFLEGYEHLLNQFGTDYGQVRQANIEPGVIEAFFGAAPKQVVLVNQQVFDFSALRGRLLSSSYTPLPGQPGHDGLIAGMRELFDRCQTDGQVGFTYDTELYFGPIV